MTNIWFLEPALRGRYPDALTFLPETAMGIKSGDMEKTRAPLDFIGINLYYRTIASAPGTMERVGHAQEWLFPGKDGRRASRTEDRLRLGSLAEGSVRHGHCASRATTTAR